jgi:tripartite-type tricarboxylate transporter receptor subunit TctC
MTFAKPGERYTAVLAGHADLLYEQIGDVRSFVENQQMRPVLLFAEKRDPRLKDVSTSIELNYRITLPQFRALIVRSSVDKHVREKLEHAVAEAASHPDYAAFLADHYADPLSLLPGEKAVAFLQDEIKVLQMLAAEQNAMVGR